MEIPIILIIMSWFKWLCFCIGIIWNSILAHLIVWHTPNSMRIYSKVLLQTCTTDLALLTMNLFFQQLSFTTDKGEQGNINGGLITFAGSEYQRTLNLIAAVLWMFLIYVSLFGYLSQFIYRYILLNWNKKLSEFEYFLLLIGIIFFPFLYCADLYICYYPPDDRQFLSDQSVADILAVNLTNQIPLSTYSYNDWRQKLGFFFIIIMCTIAYIIMITLASLINKFLKQQAKQTSSAWMTIKMIEMNKQISRNLLIQIAMPFFIYLSVLFFLGTMLFKIDVKKWYWLKYYNVLCHIPMILPSALNPIVSIYIIRQYRKVFIRGVKRCVKCMKLFVNRKAAQPTIALGSYNMKTIEVKP